MKHASPDQLPPALQSVIARVVKAERRRADRQAEHARREVYAALGEVLVKSLPSVFLKAAEHAPAGGVKVQGKEYTGGQFIPNDVMERATAEERAAVSGGNTEDGDSDKKETDKADLPPDEARGRLTTAWHPAEKAEPKLGVAWNLGGDPGENVAKVISEPLAMAMDYVAQMEKAVRAAGGSAAEARGLRAAVADQLKAVKATGGRAEKAARKMSELDAEEKAIEAELAALEVEPEEPDYDAILDEELPAPEEPDYDAVLDEEFPEVDVDVDATLDEEFPEPDEPDEVTADDYDGSDDPEPDVPDEVDAADAPNGTADPDEWADAENARRRARYDAAHEAWSSRPDDWAEAENARRRSEYETEVRKVRKSREDRRAELEEKAAEVTEPAREQRRVAMEAEHAARVSGWRSARETRRAELEGDYDKKVKAWEKDAPRKRAKLEKRLGTLGDQYGDSRDEVEEAFGEFADGYGDVLMAVSDYISELDHLHGSPVAKSLVTPDRLTREAKSLGLSLQLADLKAGVRRGVAADVWAYRDLLAACEDEWNTERYTKADRSHLVRKVIRNRLGNRQVIWINPNKAGAKNDAGKGGAVNEDGQPVKDEPKPLTREQVAEARTIIAQAVADPNKLNPEQLKDLARHVDAITKEEARGLLKTLGAKLSGDQKAVAERLVAAVRAGREQGKSVGDALRAAGNKTSGQYGAWGAAAGGGAKPVSRDEFPKRSLSPEEMKTAEANNSPQSEAANLPASDPNKQADKSDDLPRELLPPAQQTAKLSQRKRDAESWRSALEKRKPQTRYGGKTDREILELRDTMVRKVQDLRKAAKDGVDVAGELEKFEPRLAELNAEKEHRQEMAKANRKLAAIDEGLKTGKLTVDDEEMRQLLGNVGDAYKDAGYRGEYNPDAMRTSDLTGRKIRRYVELPDGRIAHPDELILAQKRGRIIVENNGPGKQPPTTPTISPAEFDRRMESIDPRDSGRVEVPTPVRPLEPDDADKERFDAARERLDRMQAWAADRPDDLRAEEQVRRAEARVREAELPDVPERREPVARPVPNTDHRARAATHRQTAAELEAVARDAAAEGDREAARLNAVAARASREAANTHDEVATVKRLQERERAALAADQERRRQEAEAKIGDTANRLDEALAKEEAAKKRLEDLRAGRTEPAPKPAGRRRNFQTIRKQAAEGMAAGAAAMQAPHDGSPLPEQPMYASLSPEQRADLDAQHRAAKTRQDARGVELLAQRLAAEAESNRRADAARNSPQSPASAVDNPAPVGNTTPVQPRPAGANQGGGAMIQLPKLTGASEAQANYAGDVRATALGTHPDQHPVHAEVARLVAAGTADAVASMTTARDWLDNKEGIHAHLIAKQFGVPKDVAEKAAESVQTAAAMNRDGTVSGLWANPSKFEGMVKQGKVTHADVKAMFAAMGIGYARPSERPGYEGGAL